MQRLVSIIIPTYNRVHFLGETLDSIIMQTYPNWECIVVDDGSLDGTKELMLDYCSKDVRIHFLERPANLKKGANSCRNFGFKKSKGQLIQWFDSDDIMREDTLEIKVKALFDKNVEYVIAKSHSFKDLQSKKSISRYEHYYNFSNFRITNLNYVQQNINWLTYDFLGKRELVAKVRFNEQLQSFQERNYFCKLTCYSQNVFIIDDYLTKVRLHDSSIQSRLKNDEDRYYRQLQDFFFVTWLELKPIAPKESVKFLFERTVDYTIHFKRPLINILYVCLQYLKDIKLTSLFWYITFHLSFFLTGKGHVFKRKLHRLR